VSAEAVEGAIGSIPLLRIAGAAAGEERNEINRLAASGCFAAATMPAANTVTRCASGGSGPTMSIPPTGRSTSLLAVARAFRRARQADVHRPYYGRCAGKPVIPKCVWGRPMPSAPLPASVPGATYVLYDGKQVYALSDQRTPEQFAAQKVRVTGTLDAKTKTIQVESISAAK
jgi:Protein of unknown function (DUF5818)